MNEELEKAISRKKKEISDYVRIAKGLHIEEAEIQKESICCSETSQGC